MNTRRNLQLFAPILLCAVGAVSVCAQVATNAPPPKPKWESSAVAGVTLTRGNSSHYSQRWQEKRAGSGTTTS